MVKIILLVIVILALWINAEKSPTYSRGAVVTLIKGSTKNEFRLLINRNKSILKHLYLTNGSKSSVHDRVRMKNLDIVCFYEEATTLELREYIQSQTPELPIVFKPIQFDGHIKLEGGDLIKLVYPGCYSTDLSETFSLSYRNMCRFWFVGFLDYVQEYDWIWRLDSDCEILGNARNILPIDFSHITAISTDTAVSRVDGTQELAVDLSEYKCIVDYSGVFVSSPSWTPLDRMNADRISPSIEGKVVNGLGTFTREFAQLNGQLTSEPDQLIDSMYAPYTNSVFFNLKWLRGENYVAGYNGPTSDGGTSETHSALMRKYLKEVDDSNCIYTSRWGDLPLLGAALSVVRQPVHWLPISYYHESHNVIIDNQSVTEDYYTSFGEVLYLLVYGDQESNNLLSTRITGNSF